MKIVATVTIRATQYLIECDSATEGADDIKRVIAELENPEVVISSSMVKIEN